MKILVINAGSSSLKYQLIDMETEQAIAKGGCERIGLEKAFISFKKDGKDVVIHKDLPDHKAAIKLVLDILVDKEYGAIKSMKEIDAVGHRMLHSGGDYDCSMPATDEVLNVCLSNADLAPLHQKANLMGVYSCREVMGDIPMAVTFDTAFHATMPDYAYTFGLPYEYLTQYKVRRYGAHGTSHRFVSEEAAKYLNADRNNFKVITCHLGNGSSISAVKGGKCIDTSMGLTPLEGVPMGTRCGDMDPAIVIYLMKKLGLDAKGMDNYMNKKSGMLGISGVSSDFRDLGAAAAEGNERAELALRTFAYKVKKYIGAYAAALNGVDAIVFTAGVGENDKGMRERILNGLDYLGVEVDFELNRNCPRGENVEISKPGSKVKVFVIPTDEELMIAKDTARLAK